MTLLDCGCGSGSITVGLAKLVEPGQVTGIDISEAEVERSRARATEANVSNISFEVGNINQLEFTDNSFDALFSHNVLEHIPGPSQVLQEMHRVLKSGGVIGIRDLDTGGFLFNPDHELLERWCVIHEADIESTGGHPRIGRQLGSLLDEVGFVKVKVSASYDVYGEVEDRILLAQAFIHHLADVDFVERVTGSGLAKAEELAAIRDAWQNWQDAPMAISAISHCEVIGRKPG
jgi:SAM-dependent methyltransferase